VVGEKKTAAIGLDFPGAAANCPRSGSCCRPPPGVVAEKGPGASRDPGISSCSRSRFCPIEQQRKSATPRIWRKRSPSFSGSPCRRGGQSAFKGHSRGRREKEFVVEPLTNCFQTAWTMAGLQQVRAASAGSRGRGDVAVHCCCAGFSISPGNSIRGPGSRRTQAGFRNCRSLISLPVGVCRCDRRGCGAGFR